MTGLTEGLCIGGLRLSNRLISAPMAHNTNLPYRILVRENGCALAYAEMANARSLVHGNPSSRRRLDTEGEPRPHAAQISGAEPEVMAEAARVVEGLGFDTVDLNMGCPEPCYVDLGAGAALMRDVGLVGRVVERVVGAVRIPVTVKIRAGWDQVHRNATEVARAAEAAGAAAVTVHGRTREQFFKGWSDLGVIGEVKASVRVPVVGNGDVRDLESARRMFRETGCDGVSIGRAACGNPWVFRSIQAGLEGAQAAGERPGLDMVLETLSRHFVMLCGHAGERGAVVLMRNYGCWYLKGVPGGRALRDRMSRLACPEDLYSLVAEGMAAAAALEVA
ncbi:MAG: tRNA dihydrouridine synthase DusB [Planctomycetes bacterium]|nr:tRNA dihydrouridine synthase DusB [Planctomycetota bacterium]